MKTIVDPTNLTVSPRALALSDIDWQRIRNELGSIRLAEVTFPLRQRGALTMYPGSWRRIPVSIAASSALTVDQLQFDVTAGGGKVSSVPDSTADPANPTIILLAGARAGTYKVVALAPVPNKPPRVVGQLEFTVDARGVNTAGDGPPIWVEGNVNAINAGQADWGEGGDNGTKGQVYPEIKPALGVRRVLTLVVDTASDRYSAADAATTLTDLRGALTDGAADTLQDKVVRSVRTFYEELSYYVKGANPPVGLTFDARVDGPISLPGTWEDYFPADYAQDQKDDPTDPEPDPAKKKKLVTRRYYSYDTYYQPVVDAALERNKTLAPDAQINFNDYDILCCVVRSVRPASADQPFKTFWPHRHFITLKIPGAADPNVTIDKNMAPVTMPDDWASFGGRTFQDTLSHEFGHSLGLGDLYTPAVLDVGSHNPEKDPLRNMADWDTMAFDGQNPHFSLVSRLKLGWVLPEWIRRFNFQTKNDVDETFLLSAVEKGSPTAGAAIGAEIRAGANWNYYIEYRSRQTGQIGDTALPANDHVVCTDAIAQGYQTTSARPEVMLLMNDPTVQSNGPILTVGQSYVEQDVNGKQIKISVISIVNGLATVRVQYKVFGVDLGIRPWPASPNRPWQSPDIEIRNEKAKKDPAFFNTAWTGQPNDIIAKITNSGTADAPGVAVQFSIKDYNVGGNTPVLTKFFKDVQTVPAGKTVEFMAPNWIPVKDGHFCVYVEILPYANAGPPLLVDMNPGNNVAQSNYSTTNLAAASPTSRTLATFKVGNPFAKPAIAYLLPTQNNPFYRTYLPHRWVRLQPNEVREVTVMMESRLDWNEETQQFVPYMSPQELRSLVAGSAQIGVANPIRMMRAPNQLAISAYMPDPTTEHMHVIRLLGGVQMQVRSGRRIQFVLFRAQGDRVSGRVMTVGRSAQPVKSGQVLVIYFNAANTRRTSILLPVVDGAFVKGPSVSGVGQPPAELTQVQAYFVPDGTYGEAFSDVISRR